MELENKADLITLRVHNHGSAIPGEALATIFEPFRRQSKARGEGLGLGLYICREMVWAHGGEIAVHSTEAAGTTFTVRLPRIAKPATP